MIRISHPVFLLIVALTSAAIYGQRLPSPELEASPSEKESASYPVDLATVLRLAGAQNLDIQLARQKVAEAQANHAAAITRFFPWIAPGVSYRRHERRIQDVTGNVFDTNKQSYTAGATIAAQLDLGDAIYKTLAARQLVKAAEHHSEAQRQDSILSAILNYFDLLKAQAAVGIAQESLKINQDYDEQMKRAVEAGLTFKGEELRVRVQMERSRVALRQTKEKCTTASARLAQTLHLDPATVLEAHDAELVPLDLVNKESNQASLVQQALRSRPELKESYSITAASKETKEGAVYGPLIPKLGLETFQGGLGGGVGNDTGHFGQSSDYAASVSWRIGPGGLFDDSQRDIADAQLKYSSITSDKIKDDIIRQVVEAWAGVQSLNDQIDSVTQALQAAEETLKLTQARKEFAINDVLENIQSEQEFTRARLEYADILTEYDKAQYYLKRVTSGSFDATSQMQGTGHE